MSQRFEAFIVDRKQRIYDLFLEMLIRHGFTFVEDIHQAVGRYHVETILTGEITLENKNLTAVGIDIQKSGFAGEVGTGACGGAEMVTLCWPL